jgi:hypothetical protein
MARLMVTVRHPGIEGAAVVPESALQHMDPAWEVVGDNAPEPAQRKPRRQRGRAAATQTPAIPADNNNENQE